MMVNAWTRLIFKRLDAFIRQLQFLNTKLFGTLQILNDTDAFLGVMLCKFQTDRRHRRFRRRESIQEQKS